jgi:hypothetical protein
MTKYFLTVLAILADVMNDLIVLSAIHSLSSYERDLYSLLSRARISATVRIQPVVTSVVTIVLLSVFGLHTILL